MNLKPREDIRPEEQCFYALTPDGSLMGYMQLFKNGSAAYWHYIGEKATEARTPEEAYVALLRAAGVRG